MDEVGEPHAQVMGQGLALEEWKRAGADAEERRKTSYDEMTGTMARERVTG